jgi:hypothetical protein
VLPIAKPHVLHAGEPKKGFIHQPVGFEGVPLRLAGELPVGDDAQAIVQEAEHRLHRFRITFVRDVEEPGDVSALVHCVSVADRG